MDCVNYRDYIVNQSFFIYCSLACGVAKGGYKGSNDNCCCQSASPSVCGDVSTSMRQQKGNTSIILCLLLSVAYLVLVETSLPLQGQGGLHLLHLLPLLCLLQCVCAAQLLDQLHAPLLSLKHLWDTKE